MNIFILDYDPNESVKYLCDAHVRKMILETAQILTGSWINAGNELLEWMPKPQTYNHPVIKAIDNDAKRLWLIEYFIAIINEYEYRFNKKHSYSDKPNLYWNEFISFININNAYKISDLTFYPMFTGFETNEKNIVKAYREYYIWKLPRMKCSIKWTKRIKPNF